MDAPVPNFRHFYCIAKSSLADVSTERRKGERPSAPLPAAVGHFAEELMPAPLQQLESRRLFAAGVLDPTFGSDGIIRADFDARVGENVSDLVVQPDGKVVALVPANGGAVPPVVLVRYNKNGTPDTTFGTGGRVNTDVGSAIALGPRGTIIIGGNLDGATTGSDFALRRYTRFGVLDTTFGQNGLATTDFSGERDRLRDLAVARDGSIAAAGDARNLGFAVARYTRDGAADATFDGDGKLTTPFANGSADARAIAMTPDGKLIVGGSEEPTGSGNEGRFSLARYNRNGSLDASFSGDGLLSSTIDGSEAELEDLARMADGRIVALGQYRGGGSGGSGLDGPVFARFNPDGSLDASFAGDGTAAPQLAPPDAGGNEYEASLSRIALDRTGMIYAAGRVRTRFPDATEKFEAAVARITRNGDADEAWGPRGLMRGGVTDSNTADDRASSIAIARDGKVVAGGRAGVVGGPFDALIGRILFDRVGGTATLSANGTLTIRGTRGSDALRTNLATGSQDLIVRINDRPGQSFNLATVRRIVVMAGDGNDLVGLWSDQPDDNGLPIRAGTKPALIDGGRGNDMLIGEDGADSIRGGAGDDMINARLGADIISGGLGTDTAVVETTDRVSAVENILNAA